MVISIRNQGFPYLHVKTSSVDHIRLLECLVIEHITHIQVCEPLTLRWDATGVFNLQFELLDRCVERYLTEGQGFSCHQLDRDVHTLPGSPSSVHSCHGPIQPYGVKNCQEIYNFIAINVRYAQRRLQLYSPRVRTSHAFRFRIFCQSKPLVISHVADIAVMKTN